VWIPTWPVRPSEATHRRAELNPLSSYPLGTSPLLGQARVLASNLASSKYTLCTSNLGNYPGYIPESLKSSLLGYTLYILGATLVTSIIFRADYISALAPCSSRHGFEYFTDLAISLPSVGGWHSFLVRRKGLLKGCNLRVSDLYQSLVTSHIPLLQSACTSMFILLIPNDWQCISHVTSEYGAWSWLPHGCPPGPPKTCILGNLPLTAQTCDSKFNQLANNFRVAL
jgi:hypothetical protein